MTTEEDHEIVGLENHVRTEPKKILVVLGSPRKNGTGRKIVETLVSVIEKQANVPVAVEYLFLNARQIDHCRGCYLCLREHEDNCPLKKDESLELKELFRGSDGFIFISPAYGLAVSSAMKLWIERVFSWLHRPFLFGRPVIVLSNAEVYGMEIVANYLGEMLETMGMHVTGKISVASP
ncbi:MAG: flavodoxin family protein, partial [bacterium]|nr:flavodoxin family protein [bacterium]